MRWPHQVHLLLRSFTGPLDACGPHLQQTGTWRLVETSKILSFNPVYWFYYCLCVFRRVAVCSFVMERSTSWVDEEKTLKPLTTSCATTRPPASSHARLLCLVPSPTMAALPYNVSAKNNANPESICKCTCRLSQKWSCRLLHPYQKQLFIVTTTIFLLLMQLTYIHLHAMQCKCSTMFNCYSWLHHHAIADIICKTAVNRLFSGTRKYVKHNLPHNWHTFREWVRSNGVITQMQWCPILIQNTTKAH